MQVEVQRRLRKKPNVDSIVDEAVSRVQDVFKHFETDIPRGFVIELRSKSSRVGGYVRSSEKNKIVFNGLDKQDALQRHEVLSHESLHSVRLNRGLYGRLLNIGEEVIEEGLAYHFSDMSKILYCAANNIQYPVEYDAKSEEYKILEQKCLEPFIGYGRLVLQKDGGSTEELYGLCGYAKPDSEKIAGIGYIVMSALLGNNPDLVTPNVYLHPAAYYFELAGA